MDSGIGIHVILLMFSPSICKEYGTYMGLMLSCIML